MAASAVTVPWLHPSEMSAGGEEGGGGEGREEAKKKEDQGGGRMSWGGQHGTRIHFVHGEREERGEVCIN